MIYNNFVIYIEDLSLCPVVHQVFTFSDRGCGGGGRSGCGGIAGCGGGGDGVGVKVMKVVMVVV